MVKASAPPKKRLARWFQDLGSRDETWQPRGAPYPRLLAPDLPMPTLNGVGGVYAIWHLGVRPQWLRVRAAADIGAALSAAKTFAPILAFQPNGGLYAAWMTAAPEKSAGLARGLIAQLRPVLQNPLLAGDIDAPKNVAAIPCPPPPGSEQPSKITGR